MAGIELDLGGTYGKPNAGDPIQYEELGIEHDQGTVEIVVYNRAIVPFTTDSDAVRRIHRCRMRLSPCMPPLDCRAFSGTLALRDGRVTAEREEPATQLATRIPTSPPRKLEPFCVQSVVSVMDLVTAAMRVDPRTGLTRIVAVGRRFQVLTVSSGR